MDREGLAAAGPAPHLAWRFLLVWVLVLGLPLIAAAQGGTGRITGTVTDTTGGVLPGVTVTVKGPAGAASTAVTDSNGRYSIEKLAPGTYTLSFELAGFATQTSTVAVVAGQPVTVETKLQIGGRAEAVQVTGTLIPRPTLEAMSPVTTLEVEELTYRGMTRVEDLLTSLPQVFTAQNSSVSNGSSGTATVNLRNLGDNRTLVLLDGRRMAPGDIGDVAPDLNFIPSSLVKRVDVLTGGASATYGADAVSGVVNFVLDRDFTGFRGGVEWSSYQHNNSNAADQAMNAAKGFITPSGSMWNSGPSDFNVALGSKLLDGKGHVTFYLDYRTTNAILKSARDYTNCSVVSGMTMNGPVCGGSSTIPAGRFMAYNKSGVGYSDYVLDTSGSGDQLRPRTSADVFNYSTYNYMQRPDKRWAGGAFMNYEENKHLEFYGDLMFMDDTTDAQIAPSGDFGVTSEVNCNNPMLSAQEVNALCTSKGYSLTDIATVIILRRSVEGGNRTDHLTHTSFRYSFGARGDINNAWKYDVYGMQAQMRAPDSYGNDMNVNNIQNALLVTGTPGQPSTWQCTNDTANCVPWNIFKAGGVTQAALNYLAIPLIYNSGARTRVVSGKVTGDLKDYGVVSPLATEGIKVALGSEYRQEYLFFAPDLAYQEFLGAGQGGPRLPVSGTYSVKEFFAEGLVPLVQDHPLAKDLSLEVGYRLSDYDNTGTHSTYKVQGSYAPTPDVKVRVGYNRASRSPNIVELFTPQGLSLGGSIDPCSGSSPTASLAACQKTGVTATQYGNIPSNPAGQYNTISGGNPNLSPETADTWTGGLVVTPRKFLPGFTAALDYYHIKIANTIGTLTQPDIMNSCVQTGNPTLCALIHRDTFGSTWIQPAGYVLTTNANVGLTMTQGLDVNATYTRPLGDKGLFTVNLIGTYLMKNEINTGVYDYDCAGYYGNTCDPYGPPLNKWRHLVRFSWESPWKLTLSVGWRMLTSVTIDEASSNPALANPGNIALDKANNAYELPLANYMDIGVTWKFRKGIQFVGGINNVLDKEPPLGVGSTAADYGAGFYNTYDSLGRYVHAGLQITF